MSKRIKWHESNSRVDKHDTEYYWHLHHWSDLYQAIYKNGIFSDEFLLEGTDGYTCKILLDPTKDHPLTIFFSSTAEILTIGLKFSITNLKSYEHVYTAPFTENTFSYYFHKSFDKNNRSYIFNDTKCAANTLSIVVKISLVTSKDVITVNGTGIKYPSGQQVLDSQDSSAQVLTAFKTLLENKTLADVTFVLGDREFPAHKAVLAAHSKIFEQMFSAATTEERATNRIELSDAEPAAFQKFLNYLYTGDLTDLEKNVRHLILLAHRYGVENLKTICQNSILANISEQNVIPFFIIADRLDCTELRATALQIIRTSPTIFETTFRNESLETLQALKQAFQNNDSRGD